MIGVLIFPPWQISFMNCIPIQQRCNHLRQNRLLFLPYLFHPCNEFFINGQHMWFLTEFRQFCNRFPTDGTIFRWLNPQWLFWVCQQSKRNAIVKMSSDRLTTPNVCLYRQAVNRQNCTAKRLYLLQTRFFLCLSNGDR